MHLVLVRVGKRLPCIALGRLWLGTAHEREAEVGERTRRLVSIPGGVRDGVRLEQHGGVARITLETGGAEVDERVRAGGSSPSRVASSSARSPQTIVVSASSASIASCDSPLYARASSTDSPSGSRIAIASTALARARPPSPAYQWNRDRTRVQRPSAASSPSSSIDLDRARDRGERDLEAADVVGDHGQLLEHDRLLGRRQPVDERRGAQVVRVRLPVGIERRRVSRGDERVVGDDALGARGLGVVDDVRGVCVGGQQRRKDLAVQPPSRDDRDARPDRVSRQLVPEANVRRVDLEQLPALGLLRCRGPVGHDLVEQRRAHGVRDDGDELDDPPGGIVEARRAPEDRVRDRGRQIAPGCEREQLGDVEGFPPVAA